MLLSKNFKNDIKSKSTSLVPLIVIGGMDEYFSGKCIFISTVPTSSEGVAFAEQKTDNFIPILSDIPSISQSVDVQSKNFQTSSVNIKIVNKYDNTYFTDRLVEESLLNRQVNIFWKSPNTNKLVLPPYQAQSDWDGIEAECTRVYTGFVRGISHDEMFVNITLEDATQKLLSKLLPQVKLDDREEIDEKMRNKPVPITYGRHDFAPTVVDYQNGQRVIRVDTEPHELVNRYHEWEGSHELIAPLTISVEGTYATVMDLIYSNYNTIFNGEVIYQDYMAADGQRPSQIPLSTANAFIYDSPDIPIYSNPWSDQNIIQCAFFYKPNTLSLRKAINSAFSQDEETSPNLITDELALINRKFQLASHVQDNLVTRVYSLNEDDETVNHFGQDGYISHLARLKFSLFPKLSFAKVVAQPDVENEDGEMVAADVNVNTDGFKNFAVCFNSQLIPSGASGFQQRPLNGGIRPNRAVIYGPDDNHEEVVSGTTYPNTVMEWGWWNLMEADPTKPVGLWRRGIMVGDGEPDENEHTVQNFWGNMDNVIGFRDYVNSGSYYTGNENPFINFYNVYAEHPTLSGNVHPLIKFWNYPNEEAEYIIDFMLEHPWIDWAIGEGYPYQNIGGDLEINWGSIDCYGTGDINVIDKEFFISTKGRQSFANFPNVFQDLLQKELGYQPDITEFLDFFPDYEDLFRSGYLNLKLAFSLYENQRQSKDIIEEICKDTMLHPHFDEGGRFRFGVIQNYYIDDDWDSATIIDHDSIIKSKISRTPIEDVYTKVTINYNKDFHSGNLKSSTDNLDELETELFSMSDSELHFYKYDNLDENVLTSDSVYYNDAETVSNLAQHRFHFFRNQHLKISLDLTLNVGMKMSVGKLIKFDKLINNIKGFGLDYTHDQILNSQHIYPLFFVTSVKRDIDKVSIEVIQLHKLSYGTDLDEALNLYDTPEGYTGEEDGWGESNPAEDVPPDDDDGYDWPEYVPEYIEYNGKWIEFNYDNPIHFLTFNDFWGGPVFEGADFLEMHETEIQAYYKQGSPENPLFYNYSNWESWSNPDDIDATIHLDPNIHRISVGIAPGEEWGPYATFHKLIGTGPIQEAGYGQYVEDLAGVMHGLYHRWTKSAAFGHDSFPSGFNDWNPSNAVGGWNDFVPVGHPLRGAEGAMIVEIGIVHGFDWNVWIQSNGTRFDFSDKTALFWRKTRHYLGEFLPIWETSLTPHSRITDEGFEIFEEGVRTEIFDFQTAMSGLIPTSDIGVMYIQFNQSLFRHGDIHRKFRYWPSNLTNPHAQEDMEFPPRFDELPVFALDLKYNPLYSGEEVQPSLVYDRFDINRDGNVDVFDLMIVLLAIMSGFEIGSTTGFEQITEEQSATIGEEAEDFMGQFPVDWLSQADFNDDGNIDILDLNLLLMYIVFGWEFGEDEI